MADNILLPDELGKALRLRREALGMSKSDLASRSGKVREVLYRLEAGEDATVSSLLAVLGALDLAMRLEPAGLPSAEDVARPCVAGQQSLDFAGRRPHPFLARLDFDLGAHFTRDHAGELADRYLESGSDVDHGTHAARRLESGSKCACRIEHEIEIPGRVNRAEPDAALACGDLGNDGRNHRARGLSRSVGVEGPHDGDRQSE